MIPLTLLFAVAGAVVLLGMGCFWLGNSMLVAYETERDAMTKAVHPQAGKVLRFRGESMR